MSVTSHEPAEVADRIARVREAKARKRGSGLGCDLTPAELDELEEVMTTQDLARLALKTLDAQQTYFKARRTGQPAVAALESSKSLERELRRAAEGCLDAQRQFFGEEADRA